MDMDSKLGVVVPVFEVDSCETPPCSTTDFLPENKEELFPLISKGNARQIRK